MSGWVHINPDGHVLILNADGVIDCGNTYSFTLPASDTLESIDITNWFEEDEPSDDIETVE